MKKFLKTSLYLLDKDDKKRFIGFIFILMLGGFVSLLGLASVIPFVSLLLDPEKIQHLPLLKSMPYFYALGVSIAILILAFWLRMLAGILILKKQTSFLFGLTAKIRNKLFKDYLTAPYAYHLNKNSSSLISTVSTDVELVSNRIFSTLGTLLNECITSLIVFIALLFIAPVLIIGVIASTLIASQIYIHLLKRKARKFGEERTACYADLNQCMTQSLGSLKETKLYHKEDTFMTIAASLSKKIASSGSFEALFMQSARYFLESTSITSILLILFIYLLLGHSGDYIVVLLSVFGIAAMQLLPSINRIVQALATMQCSYASLLKVHDELKNAALQGADNRYSPTSTIATPLVFHQHIKLQNITFSYNEKKVLDNLSMQMTKGERVALVGESGAGKTTLADIILGLLQPSSGALYVDEIRLTKNNCANWQALLGYIPQMIYLYDSDIRQNVAFGVPKNEIDDDHVRHCLKMASLTSLIEKLPQNIHTRVGENGMQLSGGQRQRIGIARALYRNPSILVMDEATAALDNKTEMEVTQALTVASKGRTIITIAHRISTIMHYDTIYYLENGSIITKGSYKTLINTSEKFRNFVNADTR